MDDLDTAETGQALLVEDAPDQPSTGHPTPRWANVLIVLAVLILGGQVVLGVMLQQQATTIDDSIAAGDVRLDGVDARIDRLTDVVAGLGLQVEQAETSLGGASEAPALDGQAGDGLPPVPQGGPDPAVGLILSDFTAPDWTTGTDVTVGGSERALVILIWAHWCPYCQQELPIMQELVTTGALDDFGNVEFLSITTFIDATRPNPLEPYLTEHAFAFPVLVDDDGSIAAALGVRAVPSWLVLDDEGTVLGRFTGAIPHDQVLSVFTEVERIQSES